MLGNPLPSSFPRKREPRDMKRRASPCLRPRFRGHDAQVSKIWFPFPDPESSSGQAPVGAQSPYQSGEPNARRQAPVPPPLRGGMDECKPHRIRAPFSNLLLFPDAGRGPEIMECRAGRPWAPTCVGEEGVSQRPQNISPFVTPAQAGAQSPEMPSSAIPGSPPARG